MSVPYDFSSGDSLVSTPPSQPSSPPLTDHAQHPPRPSFIEQLGLQFGLNEDQVSILNGLHHVSLVLYSQIITFLMASFLKLGSSLPGNLSPADLMTRVYALACQYSVEQRILFALHHPSVTSGTSSTADLKGVVDELAIRLDKSFQLGKDQKVSLILFTKLCVHRMFTFRQIFDDFVKTKFTSPLGRLSRTFILMFWYCA